MCICGTLALCLGRDGKDPAITLMTRSFPWSTASLHRADLPKL